MKRYAIASAAALSAALFLGAEAMAYPVPDVSGSTLILDETQMVQGETTAGMEIKTYKRPDGRLFREYSVGGKVFRYDIDEDGAAPYEYRIIDDDGDGEFETREAMVGEGDTPGERFYTDIGAEPGKEYHYKYEDEANPRTMREEKQVLDGYSIYIPSWVLVEF